MDPRFILLTASLSALTFGGVWLATGPTAARGAAPVEAGPITYYSGCREVRAAGKAPLHRGEPGYRSEMDGDDDGVACEDYGGAGYSGGRRLSGLRLRFRR